MVKLVHKSFPVRKASSKHLNAILEISRKAVIILYDDTKINPSLFRRSIEALVSRLWKIWPRWLFRDSHLLFTWKGRARFAQFKVPLRGLSVSRTYPG